MKAGYPPQELLPSQLERVAEVLARAFYEDPLIQFIHPAKEGRLRWLQMALQAQVRAGQLYGKVYTTADGAGAAVWLLPRHTELSLWQLFRSHGAAFVFRTPVGVLRRSLRFLAYAQKLHQSCVREAHWYLPLLGVDPAQQGKGIGSSLLGPILRQADAQRLPCYLETASVQNLGLYERHGFRLARTGEVPQGPRLWAMLREAKP